ncbi:MAG: hypothetical protein JO316_13785 [Abitibacteriaceae bacterium]|nr:hypothetical protein [Abditibacteriaceae bacterium]
MVKEAQWLVNTCNFDGIQWDYEICDNGDPQLITLLRETRAALPKTKLLSVATPMWLPAPLGHWGWSDAYFAQVGATCDQMTVMCYDSALYLPRSYVWLMRQQVIHVTQAGVRNNPRCRILLGVPTYRRGGLSHHYHAENLYLALKGVREGIINASTNKSGFAGVAPFADYTTTPADWKIYRQLWLGPND